MTGFTGLDLACRRGDRRVFAGLAFHLGSGEALLLTGPNGSGKSSLLRLMALLLRPWHGALHWDGADVAEDPDRHRARLRYVGHLDGIKPVLTVLESLGFWAELDGVADARGRCRAALAQWGLERLGDIPGRYLSAGQKRRLALARLLLTQVPLWLLDEPTVGLDSDAIDRLEQALARHRRGGGMVVASTHTPLALPGAIPLNLEDFSIGIDESAFQGLEFPGPEFCGEETL